MRLAKQTIASEAARRGPGARDVRDSVPMSPRAAASLLEAGLRRGPGEDRVTEVFASYLQSDPDAVRALCGHLRVRPLANATVLTQHSIPNVLGRVDCELRLSEGNRFHVVWIEVKTDSATAEQPYQLRRYATELKRIHPDESTLVALAPRGHEIFESADAELFIDGRTVADRTAKKLTWDELGRVLEAGAVRSDGRQWRSRARDPDTPAGRRMLVDFLSYLEKEELVRPDEPITSFDAHVVHRGDALLAEKRGAIARLLVMAQERLSRIDSQQARVWWGGSLQGHYIPWTEGWPADILQSGRADFQIGVIPTDENQCDVPRREPAFYAGLSFEGIDRDALDVLRRPGWAQPSGFFVNEWGNRNVVVRKLYYVAQLALSDITLSGQAADFARWADTVIDSIRDLPDPRELGPTQETASEPGPDPSEQQFA